MEVIGSVASIAQLIEITAKVFNYCVTVIGASKMIDDLARTSSMMLQLLYQVKQQVDTSTSSTNGHPLGPDDLISDLQACMVSLSMQFGKLSSKGLVQKLRYAHMEKDIQKTIDKASRMNGFLNSWLTLDIKKTTKAIDDGVKALHSHAEEEMLNGKIDDIVEHFAPVSFSEKHGNVVQQRQDGTGQWFLESAEFQDWVQSTGGALWCSGAPGAGKTVTASIAIEYLRENLRQSKNSRMAFVYCDYRQRQDQKAWMLLGNIWAQLFRQRGPSATEVEQLHGEIMARFDFKPTRTQILNRIRDELTNVDAEHTYIVVDALDECGDENERNSFIDSLRSLQPLVNILVTSRTTHFDNEGFSDARAFRFTPTNEDMSTYINARISESKKISGYVRRKPELEDDIRRVVIERANGMFLLCRMHLDSLSRAITLKDLKNELRRIPAGENVVKDTYDQAMERIRDQGMNREEFALRVIRWVSFARHPLRLAELLCALAVSPGDTELDEDAVGEESDITNYCAGLVVVEGETKTVRFVHYTTQEYFNSLKDTREFTHSHGDIALTCISFLGLDDLTISEGGHVRKIWPLHEGTPFLSYAALYFGYHYSHELSTPDHEDSEYLEDIMNRLLEFLKRPEHVQRAATAILMHRGGRITAILRDPANKNRVPTGATAMDVAAFFDVIRSDSDSHPFGVTPEWLVKNTLETVDRDIPRFGNPLHWACISNAIESTKTLLNTPELGLDPNVPILYNVGWQPCMVSAAYGCLGTLQVLLDYGVDIYQRSVQEWHTTLLEEAVWWAHAVKGTEKTALIDAIMHKDTSGRLLLARDVYMSTALIEAVRTADFSVFKCLMGHHNRIQWPPGRKDQAILTCDFQGRTMLHWAVTDSSLAFQDPDGAATSGPLRILESILDGPYASRLLQSRDRKGDTPFEGAIRRNHIQAVDTILKKYDVHRFVNFYPLQLISGLCLAVQVAGRSIIDLLLRKTDFALLKHSRADNILHYAASGNRPENTEYLLHKLSELRLHDAPGSRGNRPLHYAAGSGNIDAVVALLNQDGIAIDSQNEDGMTALHLAINGNLIDICSTLLKAGASINVKCNDGSTPLDLALKKRRVDVIATMANHPSAELGKLDEDDVTWIKQQPWGDDLLRKSGSLPNSERWPREEEDIIATALCLRKKLRRLGSSRPRIVSRILDLAEYWVKSSSIRVSIEEAGEVRRWGDPLTPYITSKAITSISPRPVRRVVFEITGHDQGYCSDPSRGLSWTWFTADVRRRDNTFPRELAGSQDQGTTNKEIHLVYNRGANRNWHTHTLSWSLADPTVVNTERGSWVKGLSPGDRIVVLPHARYPGWENWVHRVKIDIYTTCIKNYGTP